MLDNGFLQAVVELIEAWGKLLVALWRSGKKRLCMEIANEVNVAISECRLK